MHKGNFNGGVYSCSGAAAGQAQESVKTERTLLMMKKKSSVWPGSQPPLPLSHAGNCRQNSQDEDHPCDH